jgi:hypothetical protein
MEEQLNNGVMLMQQTPEMKVTCEKMPTGDYLTMFYDYQHYLSYGVTGSDVFRAIEGFQNFSILLT